MNSFGARFINSDLVSLKIFSWSVRFRLVITV
jgi:hypothetical protein